MNKEQKEKAKNRAIKKADFIKRYSETFAIKKPWTFVIFSGGNEIRERVNIHVKIVEYLLKNKGIEKRIKDISCALKEEFEAHPAFFKNLSMTPPPLSPVGSGIIKNKSKQKFYIDDPEKAKIWLKFMEELIQRDW